LRNIELIKAKKELTMPDIICAGFGGQGVLTLGLILSKTAMENGKNVTWIPSYGSEMRGGTANCNVKIVDGKVASPFVKEPNIVVAMNQPSVDKFAPMLADGGLLIVNTSIVENTSIRGNIEVYGVAASDIAQEEKNLKGANIVMMGALAATGILLDSKTLLEGMQEFFASKGRSSPKNDTCFLRGENEAIKLH